MTDKVGRLAGGARKIASASELARAILRSPPSAALARRISPYIVLLTIMDGYLPVFPLNLISLLKGLGGLEPFPQKGSK